MTTRITVETVIRTPMASEIRREDVTEFLAACHRHDIPAEGKIKIETKENGGGEYFRLVAIKTVEQGTL